MQPIQTVEVAYLVVASVYGLTLALRTTITVLDTVVLVAIFAMYVARVRKSSSGDGEEDGGLVGPIARLDSGSVRVRRLAAGGMAFPSTRYSARSCF